MAANVCGRRIIASLRSSFLELSLVQRKLAGRGGPPVSRFPFLSSLSLSLRRAISSFGPDDRVYLSYRGLVKIIPEVAPLVLSIYTSESGKLSVGKPVEPVGREIKVFRETRTRPIDGTRGKLCLLSRGEYTRRYIALSSETPVRFTLLHPAYNCANIISSPIAQLSE